MPRKTAKMMMKKRQMPKSGMHKMPGGRMMSDAEMDEMMEYRKPKKAKKRK